MTTGPPGMRPNDRTPVDGRVPVDGRKTVESRTGPPPLPGAATRNVVVAPGPAQPAQVKESAAPVLQYLARVGRVVAYLTLPIVMLSIIAVAVVYVRLRHGPVSFDIVVPPIESGINAELIGNSVAIEGAELRLSDTGQIEFRLRQLSVLDSDGDTVAGSPLAAVSISSAALWRGRIVPERVELIDPQINLIYTDADGLALDSVRTLPPRPAPADKTGGNTSTQTPNPATPTPALNSTDHEKAPPRQISLAKMLSDASRRARKRQGATSYLTEFGLRNATIVLDYAGSKSSWRVSEASVDFDHAKRRSVISGRASVDSSRGPWAISFVTDETEKSDRLEVKATIRDFVPSTLAAAAPPLALLKMFDIPVAGDATVELSTSGDVESSQIAIEAGAGQITHPDLTQPFNLTAALLKLSFDGHERSWQLHPSPIKWADGSVLFSGSAKDIADERGPAQWQYAIEGKNAVFEAQEFSVPAISLDTFTVKGAIIPRRGVVEVSEAHISGGGGDVSITAVTRAGGTVQSTRADVTLSPMPLATMKALWPRVLAPGARSWVGERVSSANFKGGSVNYRNGEFLAEDAPAVGAEGERLSATFEVNDAAFVPLTGMSPIVAPRALIRLENNALEVSVPEAAVVLPGNRRVPIKSGLLVAANVMTPRPDSEITFTTQAPLGPFLEAVEQIPVRAVREAAPFPKAGEGKVDAQLKIKLPLVSKLNADDVSIEGKARISDGRFGKIGGQFDVQGFTLNLELTSVALDAKGDLLVNGVPAKIIGQRILSPDAPQQPPMKITADLDEADRTQLGLDINDIVRGIIPVEISMQKGDRPEPVVKLKADLTNAEVVLDQVSWRKPAGKQAILEADIANGKTNNKTELQNFKVVGDDIAVEGWVGIGADNKLREFHFPTFAVNVVSRLEVQGTLGDGNIWNIKAHGPTFDSRDIFKSLFSVGDGTKAKSSKTSGGTDLSVSIDNVIGATDVAMHGFKMKLSTRSEKLSAIDGKGTLDGGAPLALTLDQPNGSRRLLVDSTDAGQVMKLIDVYPNLQGGRLRLEVNLDGKGPAEKTGILWVDNFRILGDAIVSEVVGSADQGRPAIGGARKVSREVFEFNQMRAPFSVGYGQFVLEESYLKGPVLGANLRGKVDFKTRRVNLGGTYIPLQGLNGALGGIPLLGQIISGTHGEGIFGITFAVQGPMSEPQVLVNPLSLVAPGIFRDVFQMTTSDPKVLVREDNAPSKPVQERVRASSSPAGGEAKRATKANAPPSAVVDGWSSTTTDGNRKQPN